MNLLQRCKSVLKRVRIQKEIVIEDNPAYLAAWLDGDRGYEVCPTCMKIRLIETQDCGCPIQPRK